MQTLQMLARCLPKLTCVAQGVMWEPPLGMMKQRLTRTCWPEGCMHTYDRDHAECKLPGGQLTFSRFAALRLLESTLEKF